VTSCRSIKAAFVVSGSNNTHTLIGDFGRPVYRKR
jgi:hypothetical protein